MRKYPPWFTYLLRCSDGTLYCGVTTNPTRRLAEHNEGAGARYTKPRRPVILVWCSKPLSKAEAYREEYRIKRLSREEKEGIILGEAPAPSCGLRGEPV